MVQSDKRQRFERAIDIHSQTLYTHIRSIVIVHEDANDVLQNTFLKAWKNLDQFHEDAKLSTWLFKIATNEALQLLRRNKKRRWFSLTAVHEQSFQQSETASKDAAKSLEKALETLTPQQRTVFGLKYYNEFKYNEIAEITGLAEGTLKAVYHQSVKKIKKHLFKDEE